ncbi:MAG: double-strand break repair helicase AddA [Alphaproteobacteria bacterium]|nr:double-strand break repair helicase AddA [Alphaproteobacteria bacterium]NCQ88553.1 double-strand break repair helicase AddA [Alphaproteobacteria bacterium]NCT06096.1 double-strand break repair helicase AddA [Alphaproteobacteria bacterium]
MTSDKRLTLALDHDRDIDPNVLQSRASSPDASSWVSASAGSGKTKVLTERMLRLLLPDKNGVIRTQANKILALTFTKAGASEMAVRIQNKLSEWVIADDDDLKNALEKLLLRPPNQKDLNAARRLFAEVTDTPGGLKIMTINSFCQSVLSRFPLEAGISPQFVALEDDESSRYLKRAYQNMTKQVLSDKSSPLAQAIHSFSEMMNEDQLDNILQTLCNERYQIEQLFNKYFDADGIHTNLCTSLGIDPMLSIDQAFFDFCALTTEQESLLYQACKALANGTEKSDQPMGIALQSWLENDIKARIKNYPAYRLLFFTTQDKIRSKLCTAGVTKLDPDVPDILLAEANLIVDFDDKLKSIKCAAATRDLFIIAQHLLDEYQLIKEKNNALDFDDQILKTLKLLKGQSMNMAQEDVAPWVRFKLDQGIDHILVDEAQDTNPEQWEIIQLLTYDFFDGENAADNDRTIFVVGDEKQSIFSFRRASPEKFNILRRWFQEKINHAKKIFDPVDINISFRSVSCVLDLVDKVFQNDAMRNGLGENILPHKAFRTGQPGLVELWPLFKTEEKEPIHPWDPPITVQDTQSGAVMHANHIAQTIKGWLDAKEPLESHDRPIEAGDIMILVRARNAFVGQLVKALKTNCIPVSGVDRMTINDELSVQDLLSAAQFALLPDDDLNLACLLKSPFIGWDDDILFDYAYERQSTLWQSLRDKCHDKPLLEWLNNLIAQSGQKSPYSFFNTILQRACPLKNKSGLKALQYRLGQECLDPVNEFLNLALHYELDNAPSLQGFVHSQQSDKTVIKREMEEAGKAVRIMTVHGAKGLQAPIVILPDTIRVSSSIITDKIIWPDRSKYDLPFFIPRINDAPSYCLKAIETVKLRAEEEYKRLLYVALTRAESRLYIGGHVGSKKPLDDSWYHYIENAFNEMDGIEEIYINDIEQPIRRFTTENTALNADKKSKQNNFIDKSDYDIPSWLFESIPQEPAPPRPLVPSRPSVPEVTVLSPLGSQDNQRFIRGNVTHRLLQLLPDIDPEMWEQRALDYVAKASHQFTQEVQRSIIQETLTILHHPEFSPIFGIGSMAEVSVTGMLDDKILISGQIDRLLVTDTTIMIIDYKTNRPPPKDPKDVPVLYYNQLKAYAKALLKIYPDKEVKTALLWTDGPHLMPLDVL